jgi:hypothetical protein
MGIEVQTVKLLLLARQAGVDFGDALTIGRQDMLISPEDMASAFARFGETLSAQDAELLSGRRDRFSDALFRRLGARSVDALDISGFEGATLIHDLNRPLPEDMAGRFSVVFDGGTLEHVFHCTTALASYMALPRMGGHLLIAVPANNEMGHGFYQFSPEFFFRTLTPENGYRLCGLFLVPMFADADWLRARDPATAGRRVGFNAPRKPSYLFVIAQRVERAPAFAQTPQQSDYSAEWATGVARETGGHGIGQGWKARVLSLLPPRVGTAVLDWRASLARPDAGTLTRFAPGSDPLQAG